MTDSLHSRFFEKSRLWLDRPALIFEDREWTFGQWREAALAVSFYLRKRDCRGENVGLLLPNSPGFAASFFGTLHSGNTVVPLNPSLQPAEIKLLAERAGIRLLFTEETLMARARQVAEISP